MVDSQPTYQTGFSQNTLFIPNYLTIIAKYYMLQLFLYSGIRIVYRYNFTHTYHKDFSNTNYYFFYIN